MIDHNEEEFEYDGPSKSQVKREMHALQGLGKQMQELSHEQLDSLQISETLRRAIDESVRIRQNEAKRRHLQYIGKIIRQSQTPKHCRPPLPRSLQAVLNIPAAIIWLSAGATVSSPRATVLLVSF